MFNMHLQTLGHSVRGRGFAMQPCLFNRAKSPNGRFIQLFIQNSLALPHSPD